MGTVNVIPATKRSLQNADSFRKQKVLRVAAYCRVSTGDESQQTSYTNQRAFYSDIIKSRPGWSFVGIYADEARSGTNRIHRQEFNRMIEDAKAGKIDYIMTKSISRFARNTIDTLECVRQLRMLNPPVGIVFEKENIDTLNATGELILTILSALAQDESRSLSDNIRWTFQKNFQAGKPQINLKRMLGYDKGENGEWLINEEQARTVRFIFEKYVYGHSANSIAKQANETGLRTVNGKMWRADSVLDILRNEKFVGDLEMQKTVTKDFLTHKSSVNRGEAPKYYIKDHHTGIIDRFTWDKTQMILKSKRLQKAQNAKRGTPPSPFSNLICGAKFVDADLHEHECGEHFFRLTYYGIAAEYHDERSHGFNPKTETETYSFQYPVWRCKRKRGGRNLPAACASNLLYECALEQSFMEMLYALKQDHVLKQENSYLSIEFKKAYTSLCRRLSRNIYSVQRMELLDGQIRELEQELQMATRNAEISGSFPHDSANSNEIVIQHDRVDNLKSRLAELKKERDTLEAEQNQAAAMKQNYDFFLQCVMKLPDENLAGMKINLRGTNIEVTEVTQAPDYLPFERGIYAAFIKSGKVYGDTIEYITSFGVRLLCTGNSRTLSDFLGYRRCGEDGTVEMLDEVWKVNGKSVTYRRKRKGRCKVD